ncbi:MAG: family 10 glycosylhydrolase [Lachnospiraceae bacterium]|nr:family 10 glycosylhydrolase [Lachnospiraceae bacterium]
MKRKFPLLMLLCAFCLLLPVSCAEEASAPADSDVPTDVLTDVLTLVPPQGDSGYRVIRGDLAEEYEIDAAIAFRKRFEELTGTVLPFGDDWEREGVSERTEKEIVIGKTNREDEYDPKRDELSRGGYRVFAAGQRVVIVAPDEKGMNAALDAFFETIAPQAASGQITVPADLALFRAEGESFYHRKDYEALNYPEMKAMWLSQYDLNPVYTDGGRQRSEKSYRTLIRRVLTDVRGMGLNTVIVQLRPDADSMYPSEVAPPSAYVTGGYNVDFKYDPLKILIEEAHALSLSVHGWINPLRAMSAEKITKVSTSFRLGEWYRDKSKNGTYLVTVDGNVYLNPAYEDVRELIFDGAAEILANYDVDGLHMDDYFYPTTDPSFDSAAYRKNGKGKELGAFRREQLNLLVSGLWSLKEEICPSALFGISPAGETDRVYYDHCADIYTWGAEKGYVDYLCPQIYWGFEHDTCAFDQMCRKWITIAKSDSVRLVIGMTFGKAVAGGDAYAGSGRDEWSEHKDILSRCVSYAEKQKKITGISFFCYQYCFDPVTGTPNGATSLERKNLAALDYLKPEA